MTVDNFFYYFKSNYNNKYIDKIVEKAKKSECLIQLIKTVANKGFHFGGDTPNPPAGSDGTKSKAFTDPQDKVICIGLNTSVDEAILSLSYELVNAVNSDKLKEINRTFLIDDNPSDDKANKYALAILKIESEAVYQRSKIALEENISHLVKNPKYVELVKNQKGHPAVVMDKIFEEMVKNGKVHSGAKSAIRHYEEMYYQFVTPDID